MRELNDWIGAQGRIAVDKSLVEYMLGAQCSTAKPRIWCGAARLQRLPRETRALWKKLRLGFVSFPVRSILAYRLPGTENSMTEKTLGRGTGQNTSGARLVDVGKSASSTNLSAALAAGPAPTPAPAPAAPRQPSGSTSTGQGPGKST